MRLGATVDPSGAGADMHRLMAELFPFCRSITGDGVRDTMRVLRKVLPELEVHEVPTGTPVLDWTVPDEWNIRDAYVRDAAGNKVIDFQQSNLHVVSYSLPVAATMSLADLSPHLHTLPEHPGWIPYRTSYYDPTWGFCLSQEARDRLGEGDYEVVIDSTLQPGSLTYGELLIRGETSDEVLISSHICHPSLANDNLSGPVVAVTLARLLAAASPRYSYRFLLSPGTIGPITWLARNEDRLHHITHGLVLTCLGDPGPFTYKMSRRGDTEIDRAAPEALRAAGRPHTVRDFFPYGYDERQFCSPGFDLPVGVLTRTGHGEFPENHTSADDLDFVSAEAMGESLRAVLDVVAIVEENRTWLNTNPKGEPQLGRRGLYGTVGNAPGDRRRELALLWVLNLSDGSHTLLDIAQRSGMGFPVVAEAAQALAEVGLLIPAGGDQR